MADNKEPLKEASQEWNQDYFPASAKKVFQKVGLWILVLVVLCTYVYFTSEPDEKKQDEAKKKKETAASNLNSMEESE